MQTVLVIAGPTASGKSGLAAAVALETGGVVINADSMQIYDGLPILTAQPSAEDLARAPHKLYGVLHPTEPCTAVRWRDLAIAEIRVALAAGQLPIITGGTGFYINTLLHGISPIPEIDPAVRQKLNTQHQHMGTAGFYAAFAARDPEMAAKLDAANPQRIIRAWEVLEGTGKSLSYWQSIPPDGAPAGLQFKIIHLLPPRETLYAQCDKRFSMMVAQGAIAEARDFHAAAHGPSPLDKAIGYPEILLHLKGEMKIEDAATLAATATRQYAKRQMTWLRNQMTPDLTLEKPDVHAALALAAG